MDPLIFLNPNNPHDSLVPEIVRLNSAFIAVACLVIGLRLFVRVFMVKHVVIEDYLMVAAGITYVAFSGMNLLGTLPSGAGIAVSSPCIGTKYGLGHHIWDLPLATLLEQVKKVIQVLRTRPHTGMTSDTFQTLWISQVMYATSLTLVKLSIMSCYYRIFPSQTLRRTLIGLSIPINCVWLVNIFATLFECTPVRAAWDFSIENRKCIDIGSVYYFSTAFSILTDLLLCILPLPLFWNLKLPKREKYIVSVLFMLGFFAAVASSIRISALHNVQNIDATYQTIPALHWSVVEVGIGIICACVPTLKPLFRTLLHVRTTSAKSPAASAQKVSGHPASNRAKVVVDEEASELKDVADWKVHAPETKEDPAITTRQFV